MLHGLFVVLKWLLPICLCLVLGSFAFLWWAPTFGGNPDEKSLAAITSSKHFNGSVFVNLSPTVVGTESGESPSLFSWLSSVLFPPPGKQPGEPLPSMAIDPKRATMDQHFTWLGHSTIMFAEAGKTVLIDPVFYRASPVIVGGKPFAIRNAPTADDLPAIDAVLISHDHYDHLDHRAIKELNPKVGHFYVPLGVKAHLQRWGVADQKITGLDWYESARLGELRFTLMPSRHFSGRRFSNRNSTLWGAWMIKSPDLSLYFSGDSGYSKEFAQIGRAYGPFDLAFIENGAYNAQWAQIHMTPEESVQAALDLRAQVVLPIHWGKFDLAYHPWREPVERFLAAAHNKPMRVTTPVIGQSFTLGALPVEKWWEDVKD